MPIRKNIIYPYLLKCCQYTDQKYWINIFEDLAYGIPPYGTYISKDFLVCSYKNKKFSYKIYDKNPEELYNDITELLIENIGLISENEHFEKRKKFYSLCKELSEFKENNWNNIKKKNLREQLIEQFILKKKNEYNLLLNDSKKLYNLIFLGLSLKVFSSNDVIMNDGKIENILGVSFENKKFILERDITDIPVNMITEIEIENYKSMRELWYKYLKDLDKIYKNI